MFFKPYAKRERKTSSFFNRLQRKFKDLSKFMDSSNKNKNFTPGSLEEMQGNNLAVGETLRLRLFSIKFFQTTAIQIKKLKFSIPKILLTI